MAVAARWQATPVTPPETAQSRAGGSGHRRRRRRLSCSSCACSSMICWPASPTTSAGRHRDQCRTAGPWSHQAVTARLDDGAAAPSGRPAATGAEHVHLWVGDSLVQARVLHSAVSALNPRIRVVEVQRQLAASGTPIAPCGSGGPAVAAMRALLLDDTEKLHSVWVMDDNPALPPRVGSAPSGLISGRAGLVDGGAETPAGETTSTPSAPAPWAPAAGATATGPSAFDDVVLSSYWAGLAILGPGVAPAGPVAVLGLAGGTCATLARRLWRERAPVVEAWEIDGEVAAAARRYFGLAALEARGQLRINVGDALGAAAGGWGRGAFAGVVVDLYANGVVIEQLQEEATWRSLLALLARGARGGKDGDADVDGDGGGSHCSNGSGRLVANLGSSGWDGVSTAADGAPIIRSLPCRFALAALARAAAPLSVARRMCMEDGSGNVLATAGASMPDEVDWARALPQELAHFASGWFPVRVGGGG